MSFWIVLQAFYVREFEARKSEVQPHVILLHVNGPDMVFCDDDSSSRIGNRSDHPVTISNEVICCNLFLFDGDFMERQADHQLPPHCCFPSHLAFSAVCSFLFVLTRKFHCSFTFPLWLSGSEVENAWIRSLQSPDGTSKRCVLSQFWPGLRACLDGVHVTHHRWFWDALGRKWVCMICTTNSWFVLIDGQHWGDGGSSGTYCSAFLMRGKVICRPVVNDARVKRSLCGNLPAVRVKKISTARKRESR